MLLRPWRASSVSFYIKDQYCYNMSDKLMGLAISFQYLKLCNVYNVGQLQTMEQIIIFKP